MIPTKVIPRRLFFCLLIATSGAVYAQTSFTVNKKAQQPQEWDAAIEGSNFSHIKQIGKGSDGMVSQIGSENASYLYQIADSNLKRNTAIVLQGSFEGFASNKNYADLSQNGTRNYTKSIQLGDDNVSFILQRGDNNSSFVQQGEYYQLPSLNNYAQVNQDGKNNDAVILQIAQENTAVSLQYSPDNLSDGNRSFQSQASTNAPQGNIAISKQYGVGNNVVQVQTNGLMENANRSYTVQGDIDNQQVAKNSYAEQVQIAGGNDAQILQQQENNTAFQKQIGMNNDASLTQNLITEVNGGNNFTSQLQIGFDIQATSQQLGTDHTSIQQQFGGGHKALTMQSFGIVAANYAATLQDGMFHNSTIIQKANANYSLVDQLGTGQQSSISQNELFSNYSNTSLAGYNTARVKQRNHSVSIDATQNIVRDRSNTQPYQRD